MFTLLVIVHLIVCLFLIFVVLIQSSKGAEMGAAFGGSTQTLFGSRGAVTFLSKVTTAAAVIFMITSLALTIVSAKRVSVMSGEKPANTAPVQPFSETTSVPVQQEKPSVPQSTPQTMPQGTSPQTQAPAQSKPAAPVK
ncbi:MAG: preprotein translocase subunit SecG [Nitrospirae bacterium]|nr:preprotein translocase subunit SecG [Nitrospirota bacterium]